MASANPYIIKVEIGDIDSEVIERIAEEVAKRIKPAALPSPLWIDPRFYPAPYQSPWYTQTTTTGSLPSYPDWNDSKGDNS